MELTPDSARDLRGYLLAHERDIAYRVDDYEDLRFVFEEVVGREARIAPLGVTIAT